MEPTVSSYSYLGPILVFCMAAAVAVPLFHRLGLGAVVGYLAAGIVIGPSALKLIGDPATVTSVAELGVVLLLFVIGLDLKLSQLMQLRRDIFGLGLTQVGLTMAVIGTTSYLLGLSWNAAIVIGFAFSVSATAIALAQLKEWRDVQTPYGQRTFSVLIFQDLSTVPMLALVPLLAGAQGEGGLMDAGAIAKGAGAIAALVLAGRYLLNPFFRLLASSGAREVMTAAALLVVLGSALLLQEAGISMAMGAFLAGLLLAESNFRHQIEADIEPFRGILLGLFFMSVGMTLDLRLLAANWPLVVGSTVLLLAVKALLAGTLARLARSGGRDSVRVGALLAPAGEFTFVLVPLAAAVDLVTSGQAQFMTAIAVLSNIAGPLITKAVAMLQARSAPAPEDPDDDMPRPAEETGAVLVIGFGRFGQVVNQVLLAQGVDITVIDNDIEQIRAASRFGFKVFYGDGTRLDVLRAAGAGSARVICICVDGRETATKIVELVHAEFPDARTFARAYDRVHAIALMDQEVDFTMRETFESALAFGAATLKAVGTPEEAAAAIVTDVRRRDIARLVMQREEGLMGGATLLHGSQVKPEPLIKPASTPRALSDETQAIIGADDR